MNEKEIKRLTSQFKLQCARCNSSFRFYKISRNVCLFFLTLVNWVFTLLGLGLILYFIWAYLTGVDESVSMAFKVGVTIVLEIIVFKLKGSMIEFFVRIYYKVLNNERYIAKVSNLGMISQDLLYNKNLSKFNSVMSYNDYEMAKYRGNENYCGFDI